MAQNGNPAESTRRMALSDLAESVFEGDDTDASEAERLGKDAVNALISKAIDFQTRGDVERAIAAYRQVLEAGLERPAVHFNLGLLYQKKQRFKDAIAQFNIAVTHPDYEVGSHFALGECCHSCGRLDEALEHFVEVVKTVDLATVERAQVNGLSDLYDHLTQDYLVKGDRDQLRKFVADFVEFLSDEGWEDRVRQARERLDALTDEGPPATLVEVVIEPESESILQSIAKSQEYLERGMHYPAMEECHLALGAAYTYLLLHHQLAKVSRAMGKVDEAVEKLVVIGDAYHARGVARQSAAVYRQALRLAPMDTAVRTKLIDLLITHGEIEEALSQYMILADCFYHLAQLDRAEEVYEEALQLVPRVEGEDGWKVRILHKIGDIHVQRVDWRKAVSVYERIRDLAPSDERARLTLMDLFYRLGERKPATEELDALLGIFRDERRSDRVFAVLEDVVERWPDVVTLRARLAQAHLNAGHTEEALEHLDHLGALQLEAGHTEQARATIEAIVALQPPNVDEYRTLLEQIDEG